MDENIRKAIKLVLFFIAVIVVLLVVIFSIRDTADDLEHEQSEPTSNSTSEITDELTNTVIPQVNLPVIERRQPVEPPDYTVPTLEPLPGADHPYTSYSDDELRTMAVSSAEAALILARRLGFSADAEQWYERAVVLSGQPGPLVEWMNMQGSEGLHWNDGELDVESAKAGYEVWLTISKFGHAEDSVARYEQVLKAAGIDLAPIRNQADKRFTRLTQHRQELVGSDWEHQS